MISRDALHHRNRLLNRLESQNLTSAKKNKQFLDERFKGSALLEIAFYKDLVAANRDCDIREGALKEAKKGVVGSNEGDHRNCSRDDNTGGFHYFNPTFNPAATRADALLRGGDGRGRRSGLRSRQY